MHNIELFLKDSLSFLNVLQKSNTNENRLKAEKIGIELLQYLDNQLQEWNLALPADTTYVKKTILAIQSLSPLDILNPKLKAHLYRLKGIIHLYNIGNIHKSPNLNQAIVDFSEGAKEGDRHCYWQLGEIYFERAIKESFPITHSSVFKQAEFCFKQSAYSENQNINPQLAESLFTKILFIKKREAIEIGHISDAIHYLQESKKLATKIDPNHRLLSSYESEINYLEQLNTLLNEAKDIERLYHLKDIDRIIANGFSSTNPIIDYYFAVMMLKKAMSEKDLIKKSEYQEVSAMLFSDIISGKNYPETVKPLLQFARGLGLLDGYDEFHNQLPKKDCLFYFQSAANQGCYLAHNRIGQIHSSSIYQNEDKLEQAGLSYYKGMLANDIGATVNYYNAYLSKKINSTKNKTYLVKYYKKAIEALDKLIGMNEETAEVFLYAKSEKEILLTKLRECSDHPHIFESIHWKEAENNQIALLLARLSNTNDDEFEQKFSILCDLSELADKKSQDKNNNNDMYAKLFEAAEYVKQYLIDSHFEKNVKTYLSLSLMERFKQICRYLSKPGHLDAKLLLEYLDPLHRKWGSTTSDQGVDIFNKWITSSTSSHFFEWLIKSHTPTYDIERAIYLTPTNRYRFQTSVQDELLYNANHEIMPDGDYIYVTDKQNNLYVASEHGESSKLAHFHHSSFLAGEHILCGGDMVVKNGKIVMINNGSGHYLPGVISLYTTIEILRKKKILDQDVQIKVFGVPPIPGIKNMQAMTINEFLNHYITMVKLQKMQKTEATLLASDMNFFNNSSNQDICTISNMESEIKKFLKAEQIFKALKKESEKNKGIKHFLLTKNNISNSANSQALDYAFSTHDWNGALELFSTTSKSFTSKK